MGTEHDSLGQVKSGKEYWPDGTPVAGQQFGYSFDDIGSRRQTRAGGDADGSNLRTANYGANALNQYTSRTVPGAIDVVGVAFATNSVQVNGQTAYRRGEYFRKAFLVDNSSTALWTNISVTSPNQASVSGNVFLPQTPEAFTHDLDGNLTGDGRWSYTWDSENRLISMVANTTSGPQQRLDFEYDWQGRRIRKDVLVYNPNIYDYELSSRTKFAYDGWNPISVLTSNLCPLTAFTWGLDISGSEQGAGGIGGLLFCSEISNLQVTNCASPCFDGNGNVADLVTMGDGNVSARYEYGPFGEVVRATGPMATGDPFRFSTKYQDDETDLLYYGYRYYNASTGRWLSRDPAEEQGGENIYVFSLNCAVSHYDILGEQAAGTLWSENCCSINRPEITDARFCCCDDKKLAEGRKILEDRWIAAVNYLNPKGPIPDPHGVGGVSCVASANAILAFMRPIPACWKCFIQRRWWNYSPLGGDENSILCQSATRYTYGYGAGQGWTSQVVFDWWYPLYMNYHKKAKPPMPYQPMSPSRYSWSFPWAMPDLNGEWTENSPADYNTCLAAPDRKIRPMDYTRLVPLLPPYPTRE